MNRIPGIIIIVIGICLNQFTFQFISNYATKFDSIEKSMTLLFFQLIIIIVGIYVVIKRGEAFKNLSVLFLALLLLTILLEIILSIPYFQNLESSRPIWIPWKYEETRLEINKKHQERSLSNKYNFNDDNHSYKKDDSSKIRIVVLGDSFVWGAGIPDSVIWTRKLERLFIKKGIDCEIFNWGISGWSTLDQYNFLKTEGYKYQFDYLVFSFVVNDPVMDSSSSKQVFHPSGFIDQYLLKPIVLFFPNTVQLFTGLINNFFFTYSDHGPHKWLVNKVYSEYNLKKYSGLLNEIKQYCEARNIPYSFIMTPENHNPVLNEFFKKVEKKFDENNILYYNLYPVVKNELKQYSVRELWANPADGHPGDLVTEVYAKYGFSFLSNKIEEMRTK